LADQPIVRLILDGTVVRVRLDRKATTISLLVVLGVRADGQKILLASKSMGSESAEAWRVVLDDLIRRGLRRPEFLIVDGAAGLDKAIAAVWADVPVQRCTVHKLRNLPAHAPELLHEEITADYQDTIYALTRRRSRRTARPSSANGGSSIAPSPIASRRPASVCSPSPACRRANGGARGRPTPSSALHEEFKRRIKTQTVLPSADTAAMLFWALLASGQINMRKVDGWQTLPTHPIAQPIDLAA
jgi:putative transposase